MAIYNFKAYIGSTIAFNPITDQLLFNDLKYLANVLSVSQTADGLVLSFAPSSLLTADAALAGSVTLLGMTLENVSGRNSPVNIAFMNGGALIVGDDMTGDTNDNLTNSLVGTDFNDMMLGLGGDDTLSGRIGNDHLDGGAGNDILFGDVGEDKLYGGAGDDSLDGGLSSSGDLMVGGDGNDSYRVDSTSDVVAETNPDALIGGIDTSITSVDYALTANVENLTLFESVLTTPSSAINNIDGTGNTLDNTILGNTGFNTLDGGSGADLMIGGSGDDVYVVDDAGDVVVETDNFNNTANDGSGYILIDWIDTVRSSINYTLTDFVENLQLMGSADLDGTGNALDNIIYANTGNNRLDGAGDNDSGTANPDEYAMLEGDTVSYQYGATAGVVIRLGVSTAQDTYGSGVDTLIGFENVIGSSFDDELTGDAQNNVLNGGCSLRDFTGTSRSGADLLIGGDGNDSYIVDGFDTVVETNASTSQIDTVYSWTDYRLTANVENLRLLGLTGVYPKPANPNSNAIGNALNNVLTGNDGNNVLDGGVGADTMYGGGGDDTFIVDNVGDEVFDTLPFPGSILGVSTADTVRSTISYTLGAGIEKLQLMGSANLNGTGNGLVNMLWANSGNNALDGAAGTDTVSYEFGARAGVTIDLQLTGKQATGGSGFDTLLNIENVTGSSYNDFIVGTSGGNALDGGRGIDTVSYASATSKVTVTLGGLSNAGSASGGGGSDGLLNFENVIGSAFDDSLVGTGGNNILNGGVGNDTVSYETATPPPTAGATAGAGVVVNLSKTTVQNTGGSGYDTLLGIENLTGSKFNDILTGTSGANVLKGMAGADTLSGGSGDDLIEGGDGDDLLDGGSGTDTLSYQSAIGVGVGAAAVGVTVRLDLTTAQVTGSAVTGSAGTDTVTNFENLIGSAFNDTLTGNTGANVIDGGLGSDKLDGGAGIDTLSYASATAKITLTLASTGPQATGGSGSDTVSNFENLIGGTAGDLLTGDTGSNVIDGGAGNDTLDGGAGSDTLSYASATSGVAIRLDLTTAQVAGGSGSDKVANFENLIGSAFNDTLSGDAGNNVINGGAGSDTLSYQFAAAGISLNLGLTTAQATGGAGSDTISNVENLVGSGFDDILTGNAGANVIDGAAGNDVLNGGAGIDTLSYASTAGAVTLDLRLTTAQLTGGAGTDTVSNFENLLGSGSSDTLTGNDGNNVIDGGAGSDLLNGGLGTDTLSYATATGAITVSLLVPTAQTTGGSGSDTVSNFENLLGSNLNDKLTGDGNNNLIDGAAGSDTLDGGAGIDTLSYATASLGVAIRLDVTTAQVTIGSGSDMVSNFENLIGSAFNDTLGGNAGSNALDGGAGIDTLSYAAATGGVTLNLGLTTAQATGGAGSDTVTNFENLIGSAYNDTLTASAGSNVLDGGTGIDTLSYASASAAVKLDLGATAAQITGGSGTDTVTNFENLIGSAFNDTLTASTVSNVLDGGSGIDTLSYASASDGVTLNLGLTTTQNTIGSGSDKVTNFENLTGSGFDDSLTGNSGANVIDGGAGNDALDGSTGIDTLSYASASAGIAINLGIALSQLTVGSGTDTIVNFENLTGSAYNDILTGNSGSNALSGGAGADLLDGGLGSDVIDGGTGTDTLSYQSASSAVALSLALATAQTTGGSGSDTVTNVENLLGSAYNDTLTGNTGANVIDGGAGSDKLDGGTGTDTLSYQSASGAIKLSLALTTAQTTGGSGSDTVSNFENLLGSTFNDTLTGSTGSNVIDGGAGDDKLDGGAGTDTLSYKSASGGVKLDLGVTLSQLTGGSGSDTVSNFENLLGSAFNDTLTGNALGNVIEGGAGYDVLNGGDGIDTLSYLSALSAVSVNLGVTTAQATGGAGTDTAINFENLLGSNYNDSLTGNGGANLLDGGAGCDSLDGGAGNDIFRFSNTLGSSNVDQISNYVVANDSIQLENKIFTKLTTTGTLSSSFFVANTTGAAGDANDYIVYEKDTGKLFYDADGSGAGATVQIALIGVGLSMTSAEFSVT